MTKKQNKEFSAEPSVILQDLLGWLRGFHLDRERSKAADWAMVLLTFFTLIAAIVSAVYFQRQLAEARRGTNAAVKNFMLDERAWVQPAVNVSQYKDVSGKYIEYAVGVKNVGKTVASNVVITIDAVSADQFDIRTIPNYQRIDPLPGGGSLRVAVIAPNSAAIETVNYPIHEGQVAHSMTKRDYIIGRIDYKDEFKARHWATYCFIVRMDIPRLEGCGMEGSANQADDNPEPTPDEQ
jgi:hypothetical protein